MDTQISIPDTEAINAAYNEFLTALALCQKSAYGPADKDYLDRAWSHYWSTLA